MAWAGGRRLSEATAMASSAAGNRLKSWQPWSQLIPSMAGLVAMVLLAVWYFKHPPRQGRRNDPTTPGNR